MGGGRASQKTTAPPKRSTKQNQKRAPKTGALFLSPKPPYNNSMKTKNTKLIQELIKNNSYVKFYKKHKLNLRSKDIKLLEKSYREILNDESTNTRYDVSKSRLKYFYNYEKSSDLGEKVIFCEMDKPPKCTKEEMRDLLKEVSSLDKRIKKVQFYIPFGDRISESLENLGAKNRGLHLMAKVEDGLNYLSKYEYDSSIEVCDLSKKDLNAVVNLEYLAHKNSKTTRCATLPKKSIRALYSYLIKAKKKVILLKENSDVIGVLALSSNNFKIGHVMTIAVHPEHQKRGVSKLLYFEGLKYWKKQGVNVYSGVTTTHEVLGLAKRLKRVPVNVYYEFNT
jgi:N-acetylglutamate synthase-like GNAT family acetyltransferase